jgi:hypothetical protein
MPAREESEENNMLVRIGNAGDVADGEMRVYDVAGTNGQRVECERTSLRIR